ncbi:MAG TPA: nitroreductase/quinone reductase family protein [Dehalococcoidia bacterium]|nr:nitroreductase/quinone reductase family protein [Dehalococcoidia bacterium]
MAIELTPNGTLGAQPPRMPKLIFRAFMAVNVAAYHLLGTRMRPMGGYLCLVTTIGARTGKPRRTPLIAFPSGDGGWLLIASYGGAVKHPQWVRNLAKHPDDVILEVNGGKLILQATSLLGEERQRAWERIVAQSPRYGNYASKTDRIIPLIRLAPRP